MITYNIRFSLRKLSVGLVSVGCVFLSYQSPISVLAETMPGIVESEQIVEHVILNEAIELVSREETQESISNTTDLDRSQESVSLSDSVEADLVEGSGVHLQAEEHPTEDTFALAQANLDSSVNSSEDRTIKPSVLPEESLTEATEPPVSHYTTEDGQYWEIIWAHGLTPPSMEQGGDFKKVVTGDFVEYHMPYEAGNGYYDANKSLNASLEDLNLCFAAVSSNMLHWWLEQNSDYVDRFIEEKYDSEPSQQDYALTDLRRYPNSFEDQQNSRIFNLFKAYYGHRLNGFVSDALVDLFINGYSPKSQGGVNLENPDLVPDKRGGFFYEVFKEKKLTDRMFSGDYRYFGNLVRSNLENQGLLGLSYRTFGTTTHIVTVWGAEYDEQGQIRAVYITDSDDQHEPIGLKRMGITRDSSGNPRLTNNVVRHSFGSQLDYVHTINLGRKHWETYFNPIEEAKQKAKQTLEEEKVSFLQAIREQEEFSEQDKRAYSLLVNAKYAESLDQINQVTDSQVLAETLKSALQSIRIPMQFLGPSLTFSRPTGHLELHGTSVTHELPEGHLSLHGSSVTHDLPEGHLSLHGSSVMHELPDGYLSLRGFSVTHELPEGHLSLHGSSVTHELPEGHLSLHGSSVTHELPDGYLSLHGSSVTHELPEGHLSLHGSSVMHELPEGHLSLHGSSVTHELPEGYLSLHGSSVTHELPEGHLSLHGSSVTHELPDGYLSLRGFSVTEKEVSGTGRVSPSANTILETVSARLSVDSRESIAIEQNRLNRLENLRQVSPTDAVVNQGGYSENLVEMTFSNERVQEKQEVTIAKTEPSSSQKQDKSARENVAKEFATSKTELEDRSVPLPYLAIAALLVTGLISYWALVSSFFKAKQ
ncbi:TPA: IdeS/Mac family cysteine endopeptidase [Streptococcus suis]